ncbi:MAG TPA: formyltransferase family protein [Burkholderiaceae bacterium]|jgi:methionyl-tRNA formyltransferase|nr:formyltransferase family protein [Burkholderiaceae bacterium]
MKLAIVGSRYFGATVFEALRKEAGVQIVGVVAPEADDRLAKAALAAGVALHVLANPKIVPGEAVPEVDLIVAAHTHARVSHEALARSRLGGVGYHPSLLPRHRGIAAVEWTILEGDPIAGGSVYHLADGWDAGAVAAQDWCFVGRGDTARDLWERDLAPMGLRLLAQVVRHAREHGVLPAKAQDPRFATKAPMLKKAVVLTEDASPATTSVVATVMGPDRPGIVRALSDRAQRQGANWTVSHMARIAGEFAGMVHFEVAREKAEALAESLRALEPSGLKVAVATSEGIATAPAGWRGFYLELVGDDRVGIVADLTRVLAERGISIERLNTETLRTEASSKARFKVGAHLLVPARLDLEVLRAELGALASSLMVDIALGEQAPLAHKVQ